MTTLVIGATGATGRHLVRLLLDRGQSVRAIVRSEARLPEDVRGHERLAVTTASLLELSDADLDAAVEGCTGIASCLGHTLSFKGIWGKPRRLVTDATRRLTEAARRTSREGSMRYILMNTSGNANGDLDEPRSGKEKVVIGLIRALVPPHSDNEQAAEILRVGVGQNDPNLEWVAVRPDGLIDADEVTPYTLHPSPIRSPIFDAGKTSRINVADFMARLFTEDELWAEWKGRMPVIYNAEA